MIHMAHQQDIKGINFMEKSKKLTENQNVDFVVAPRLGVFLVVNVGDV